MLCTLVYWQLQRTYLAVGIRCMSDCSTNSSTCAAASRYGHFNTVLVAFRCVFVLLILLSW